MPSLHRIVAVAMMSILSFMLIILLTEATPGGGGKHEKHIIHVPIKYHTVHHVKVEKIPVYVKKHIHHHRYEDHHPEPQHQLPLEFAPNHSGYDRLDNQGDDSDYSFGGSSHLQGSYENSNEYYR